VYIEKEIRDLKQELKELLTGPGTDNEDELIKTLQELVIAHKINSLLWQEKFELAIQDNIEDILNGFSLFDFVYLIQDKSTQSGETKIVCRVDITEQGPTINGKGSTLPDAIKDAAKQIDKLQEKSRKEKIK